MLLILCYLERWNMKICLLLKKNVDGIHNWKRHPVDAFLTQVATPPPPPPPRFTKKKSHNWLTVDQHKRQCIGTITSVVLHFNFNVRLCNYALSIVWGMQWACELSHSYALFVLHCIYLLFDTGVPFMWYPISFICIQRWSILKCSGFYVDLFVMIFMMLTIIVNKN